MKVNALLAAAGVLLSACALPSVPGEPAAHKVNVDGAPYLLSQLTASTWTASTAGRARPLKTSFSHQAALLQAIEKTSGCKVTDSDYSRQGLQLDAQVDCGSKLKN
ncbi:MAG: hypothetical protein A3E79_14085 [Burkholderiales bacterium RIFCSPHIGHO2_12_FULL_61_11]|nr:MAG: hypothetical protein A3E79_14085 [Burkholderiales bacterium RIFCSPHIGHO2_12_FULL_61_11]